jgi:NAD(P)-dependent dehydrogenase (short-subunit alcohol dehydrogenase family)
VVERGFGRGHVEIPMERQRFAGKKVLVTGAGTGIGREIALEFAREGADVVLHYAHSGTGAESAVAEIQAMGRRAAALKADFGSLPEPAQLARRAIEFLGGLDCLVNNAGITFNKPFLKVAPEQYETVFNVNMRAQFFLTQAAVGHMLEHGGGAICNLTSVHGLQAAPEHTVYAATKGAIIAYTRVLGVELAHKGIRVNAIAPGWIMVENHAKAVPDYTEEKARADARDSVPAGRPGVPVEIAKMALFLCSDDAQFIVGQTVVVDGGTTSLMSLISDFRHESSARFGAGYVSGV